MVLTRRFRVRQYENSSSQDLRGKVFASVLIRYVQQMRAEITGLALGEPDDEFLQPLVPGLGRMDLLGALVRSTRFRVYNDVVVGDVLEARAWFSSIGKTSFTVSCVLDICGSSERSGRALAAYVTQVYVKDGSATAIPDLVREALSSAVRLETSPSLKQLEIDPPEFDVESWQKQLSTLPQAEYSISGGVKSPIDPDRYQYHLLVRDSDCDWNDHLTNARFIDFIRDGMRQGAVLHGVHWLKGELEWMVINFDKEGHIGDSLMVVIDHHGGGELRGVISRTRAFHPDGSILFHHVPRILSRFWCRIRPGAINAKPPDSTLAKL